MDGSTVAVISGPLGALVGVGAAWGVMRAQVTQLQATVTAMAQKLDDVLRLGARVDGIERQLSVITNDVRDERRDRESQGNRITALETREHTNPNRRLALDDALPRGGG
jgi:hypothetical protein